MLQSPFGISLLVLAAAFAGCAAESFQVGDCAARPNPPSRQVLLIGVDGLRFDAVSAELTPRLWVFAHRRDSLLRRLDASDNRRQKTYSGPAWVSVLTASPAATHGIRDNESRGPVRAPTLAQRLAVNDEARTVVLTPWAPLADWLSTDEHNLPGARHLLSLTDGGDAGVERLFRKYWSVCHPDLTFLHLGEVDDAGHSSCFSPDEPRYRQALADTDARIGRLLDQLPTGVLTLVVSDHGGVGNHHGGFQPEERMVPLVINNPSAVPLLKISSLADVGAAALQFLRTNYEIMLPKQRAKLNAGEARNPKKIAP